ncbi:lipoprotein insertase outer membrane protein LolB1 [Viscerimonas tarda]
MGKIKLRSIAQLVLLSAFMAILPACGSKKTNVSSGGTLSVKSQSELIADVLNNELKYTTISGKMDMELRPANSKSGMKTAVHVKVLRDSIVQLSIRPLLGLEVIRISITPSSALVIDRMNKKYALERIGDLQASRGVYFNYYNLQALLTNSLFLPGQQSVTKDDYRLFDVSAPSGNMYQMKTVDKSGLLYNFAIDPSDRIVSALIFSPGKNYTLQWTYDSFVKDANYIYPTKMLANVDIEKKRFDVEINYSKLDINSKVEIDDSIPNKYDKASIADIIGAYMKIK